MSAGTPGAHLRAEIIEQPDRWTELADAGREELGEAAGFLRSARPELIVLIARGSSDHAAQYAQYLAHNLLGVPCLLATPATFTAYHARLRWPRSVGLAISQSGESPDLLATVDATQAAGVRVIGLTNDTDSSLAALADLHVPLLAGPERSVAATKTYTCELLALHIIIALAAGMSRGAVRDRIAVVSEQAARIIREEVQGQGLLASFETSDQAMVVGRGYGMATAREGALKLMETCSMAASGWSASDATHGPLGQVRQGMPVVGLMSDPATAGSVGSFLASAEALGAQVRRIELPTEDHTLTPLLDILPLQAAALRTSLAKGLDPDAPPGLAKVTRTL